MFHCFSPLGLCVCFSGILLLFSSRFLGKQRMWSSNPNEDLWKVENWVFVFGFVVEFYSVVFRLSFVFWFCPPFKNSGILDKLIFYCSVGLKYCSLLFYSGLKLLIEYFFWLRVVFVDFLPTVSLQSYLWNFELPPCTISVVKRIFRFYFITFLVNCDVMSSEN